MATGPNTGILLGFAESLDPACALARAAGLDFAEIEVHHFPDGESRVSLPASLPGRVVICRSLDQPNQKLLELLLAAATARELGAGHLTLVAPYLCYMRQDKAFHPGEAVSQRVVGKLLADNFDALITVDPHLHRVSRLEDAIPVKSARALAATEAMAAYLEGQLDKPLLIGPDEESQQWVAAIAARNRLEYCVARKQRYGDADIKVTLPDRTYRGRHLVLVDDIASTGSTLEVASRELWKHRPASISVMVTHALFVGDALARIKRAGVEHIWSSDSIVHPTNRIRLAGPIASALMELP